MISRLIPLPPTRMQWDGLARNAVHIYQQGNIIIALPLFIRLIYPYYPSYPVYVYPSEYQKLEEIANLLKEILERLNNK